MRNPPNRGILLAAVAAIALILGVTYWRSIRTPEAAPVAAVDSRAGDGTAATGTDASGAGDPEPAFRDVWAGRAMPPRLGEDGKPSLLGTEEDRARARQEYAALARDLEENHASQPVDAAWKGPAEATLGRAVESDALARTGMSPEDVRTDCRSSSCKVTATFPDPQAAQDWATMFTAMTGSTFQSARFVTVPTPGGGVEVRIYGTRR
jgi:hypothetical protein